MEEHLLRIWHLKLIVAQSTQHPSPWNSKITSGHREQKYHLFPFIISRESMYLRLVIVILHIQQIYRWKQIYSNKVEGYFYNQNVANQDGSRRTAEQGPGLYLTGFIFSCFSILTDMMPPPSSPTPGFQISKTTRSLPFFKIDSVFNLSSPNSVGNVISFFPSLGARSLLSTFLPH